MKIKEFDVVELYSNEKATILKITNNEYFAELVDAYGQTVARKNITPDEIKRIIYTK